ncbi:MAG: tyrosine-protein phosphatase [Deltaproteobacteria bacterium]|nr:tyrosine-protein phosphatase [Candidatus Zymogenaceae bacterium]
MKYAGRALFITICCMVLVTAAVSAPAGEERWIEVEGVENVRDIGGYPAGDDTLAWGRIYRSADITGITDTGIAVLEGLGVVTVVDLRPHPDAEALTGRLEASGIRLVSLPMEKDELSDKAEFYRRIIVLGRDSLAELLFLAADERALPMLLFDGEGTDEVEVAAMLLMGAAGVSGDDLVRDYLLSNQAGADVREEWGRHIVDYFDEYGGIRYYTQSILNVPTTTIDLIHNNLIR